MPSIPTKQLYILRTIAIQKEFNAKNESPNKPITIKQFANTVKIAPTMD